MAFKPYFCVIFITKNDAKNEDVNLRNIYKKFEKIAKLIYTLQDRG